MATMTVHYCSRWADLLSMLRPSTESEIQLYFTDKRQHRPVDPKGTCDKCGQTGDVSYYQFPG